MKVCSDVKMLLQDKACVGGDKTSAASVNSVERTSDVADVVADQHSRKKGRPRKVVVLVNYSKPVGICSKWLPHILTALLVKNS